MPPIISTPQPQIVVPAGSPELLRDLIHQNTGICFDDRHLDAMLDKLRPVMVEQGVRSLLDYYYILKERPAYFREWRRVMDAVAVQETYFWREMDQIDAVVKTVVPEWFSRSNAPLRIWIAACSTGEEAFSLVIALEEAGVSRYPIQVVASDASEAALDKARTGLYRERAFRATPPGIRAKYFRQMQNHWMLNPEILSRVRFERVNLMTKAETNQLASAPVIFCRNVFIYFSQDAVRQVLRQFAERMPPGGRLCVGASESLLSLTTDFELKKLGNAFVYERKPHAGAQEGRR